MDFLQKILSFTLSLDTHLLSFMNLYGAWTYILLFVIIFSETAFIFMAFLPGDSLIFATGALIAKSNQAMNIHIVFILLVIASILGNNLNYLFGKYLGPKVFRYPNSWLFNQKHLQATHAFYETYGGKAIILARFMPIIRSFAPFVAGIGYMTHGKFFFFNAIGGLLWIGSLLYMSFFFGNLPMVRDHFSAVIIAIIIISFLPASIELGRQTCKKYSTKS